MSDKFDKDLDLYLQNLKKTSKKPGWLGISILSFFMIAFFIGFYYIRGLFGILLLFCGFFILLMIIGSFMVSK